MELFRSELYYIFVRNESSLWWNRISGAFSVRSAWDLSDIEDIECLGITEGIIGKVEHSNVLEPRLVIIKESVPCGQLYFHHTVYKIKSICLLHLGATNQEIELSPCTKHGLSVNVASNTKKIGTRLFEGSVFLNKTVGAVKNVSNTIKTTTQHAASQVKQTVKKHRDPKLTDKLEKRILDELHKIFDDTDSFYYSRTLDLTNSLQRQYEVEKLLEADGTGKPVTDITRWWKHVDDRFFWNKHMLKDIISLESPACDEWVLPIIQGYVQLSQIPVETDSNPLTESAGDDTFTLGVVSRRSRYRAGTRYNRRGIGPGGKVANYVETEQIVSITCGGSIHRASFIQVRGSVPIYWSQPEMKFRPPPRLDRTEEESHAAFVEHFEEEMRLYKHVSIINLVEQTGRERIIWEAYGERVLQYNSPNLVYTTFDFHEYCRGMHYENVSVLINAVSEMIDEMRFCWRDERGLICGQNGVFRVNCIDCLDRTNVVQTAIAKYVLELQLCQLGLSAPGRGLPPALRGAFLTAWADNGDTISRQYAGTKALKGDYTRTGERKWSGMMKDGVNSASRYYLSTFKDALRQVAIDVMSGEAKLPEQLIASDPDRSLTAKEESPVSTEAMAQHVKSLIDDCRKLLVDTEPVLGAWGLIDADPNTGDPQETEMDTVVLLTGEAYHVADYDETSDRVLSVQCVPLRDVTSVELGPLDNSSTIFGVGRKTSDPIVCIRLNYLYNGEAGYFHMFRSTTLRFFNNMAVAINTRDEMIESLHAICESILVARDVAKLPPIPFQHSTKLERRKSKVHPIQGQTISGKSSLYLELSKLPTLTKNVSETQLVTDIRNVGTKALSNMSEQFSKLNKFSHSLNTRPRPALSLKFDSDTRKRGTIFTLGHIKLDKKKGSLSDGLSSDYSSDDENRTNIFEPTLDNFENTQHYIGTSGVQHKEEDCELIENPLFTSTIEPSEQDKHDQNDALIEPHIEKQMLKTPSNPAKVNPFDVESRPPEIQIEGEVSNCKPMHPNSLLSSQKLSHSSSEINYDEDKVQGDVSYHRSNSQHEIALNIIQSHSESALKQLQNATSPSTATREMVLSPFTKLAKGVQSLGANLDPRKIKPGSKSAKNISEQHNDEHRKLHDKWRDCKTRLIAL